MTRLHNDPARFADEMIEGLVAAHSLRLRGVRGGVVRATACRQGKVAVVIGGGSGHYPAFAGLVGTGFADGAVVGNVFTSPSTPEALRVARAADHGGGVLLSYGNYAGDVMNFGLAVERLTREGIEARTVLVTDDIASAPADHTEKRRGVAGDFAVFKVASAAAEAGSDLDEVERIARKANARTRSLGVGFAGCTLPGADEPLFHVESGTMGVGLGIHGEPGVSEDKLPTADGLAELLVDRLLQERPAGADSRAAVILNGLGATKYEELFVVWRGVARRLEDADVEVVEPEIGELVTSLDMAGCSLTLFWLDDELEALWRAPADTPAYRKGYVGELEPATDVLNVDDVQQDVPDAADPSRRAGERILAALRAMQETLHDREEELGRIDAVAGDGDHGTGMTRGIDAAVDAAEAATSHDAGAETTLAAAGDAWAERAGGTSGALWGAALFAWGAELGNDRAVTADDVVRGARGALDAMTRLGKAEVGDKTLIDALAPFVETLEARTGDGAGFGSAWADAAEVATRRAEETADLRPRRGRARPLAERSIGTPDAGATSLAMCARSVTAVIDPKEGNDG